MDWEQQKFISTSIDYKECKAHFDPPTQPKKKIEGGTAREWAAFRHNTVDKDGNLRSYKSLALDSGFSMSRLMHLYGEMYLTASNQIEPD
jgi:hypothetical protein